MNRVAVFVDAGYLFAAAGMLLKGRKTSRGELCIDVNKAEAFLRTFAEDETQLPLLRIYWYDGTDSGPSQDHVRLMWTQNIKVQLGIVNRYGQQKGVDSLMVTDIINLARCGRVASAMLITGDEDIRVGVQQAQAAGIRVHLVGIEPKQSNQSNLLQQEADIIHEWGSAELGVFLSSRDLNEAIEAEVDTSASREEILEKVVRAVIDSIDDDDREQLRSELAHSGASLPREHDVALIKTLAQYVEVEQADKMEMRRRFRGLI